MLCDRATAQIASLLHSLQERLEGGSFEELSKEERGSTGPRARFYSLLEDELTIIELSDFVERVTNERLLIFGDYHPLAETKRVLKSLFEKALSRGIRPLIALDCLGRLDVQISVYSVHNWYLYLFSIYFFPFLFGLSWVRFMLLRVIYRPGLKVFRCSCLLPCFIGVFSNQE